MSTTGAGPPPNKTFSCIKCFERKVKCDKQSPCTNCVKAKVECIFRVPPPARRKKKRPQEEILLARLRTYEQLLKSKGIEIDELDDPAKASQPSQQPQEPASVSASASTQSPPTSLMEPGLGPLSHPHDGIHRAHTNKPGQLYIDHGKTRFIENHLWTSVSHEFQPKEAIDSGDEDDVDSPTKETADMLLGYSPATPSLEPLHPTPDQINILWHVFLDNVDPMTKLIHHPTLQRTIQDAATHLDRVPRGLEALMFAIYAAATFSLTDDECEMKLGESQKTLLARYRLGTRKALARAKFMATSELTVLQAFIIYLITMREQYDSRTTWTLAGVASRVAQGMGLHRDGAFLGLPPFETELRRRLWWQISILDFRSAELSGSGRFGDFSLSDTQPPTNVNDEDIYPDMTAPPVPHTRPTEMIACLLRCEFGSFLREKVLKKAQFSLDDLRISSPWSTSLAERDAKIEELERRLEEKFLRYCDPTIPIQFFSIIVARSALNSMRMMAHHPRRYPDHEEMSESEKAYMFNVCSKLLELDNLIHATKPLQRFLWHANVYFQWQALVYVLNELQTRTFGDEVDRTWAQVDEVFGYHANFVTDKKKPLHVAVGSLCLKAYRAREQALQQKTNGRLPAAVPEYIRLLREQRKVLAQVADTDLENANAAIDQMPVTKWHDHLLDAYPAAPPTTSHPLVAQNQMPLPTFPPQTPFIDVQSENLMFPYDPNMVQDLAMADMPLDWAQWDYVMQDFPQPR